MRYIMSVLHSFLAYIYRQLINSTWIQLILSDNAWIHRLNSYKGRLDEESIAYTIHHFDDILMN